MAGIKIIVADDHQIVRQGLRTLMEQQPGWKVVAEADSGKAVLDALEEHQPDVLIIDLQMPEMGGLQAIRQLRRRGHRCEIIVFSTVDTAEEMQEVLSAGARSFLLKADAATHLIPAVEAAIRGKPYFSDQVSEILFARMLARGENPQAAAIRASQLTERELETLCLLAAGNTNKEVAATLHLSTKAIEKRRAALMQKLGLQTFSELVRFAVREGIVK